jgi:hypothetical protein
VSVFPPEFDDLEPFAAWAIPTERARYEKRLASSMDELEAFYNAAMARIDDALEHLDRFDMAELDEAGKHLLWLYCSFCTASFPVEVWRQQRVPDSGSASFDAVLEPAV